MIMEHNLAQSVYMSGSDKKLTKKMIRNTKTSKTKTSAFYPNCAMLRFW